MEMNTCYVVVNSCGTPILSYGDVEAPVWMHSTAKPFQLLPLLERKLDQKYSLTPVELVFLASSHLAQPQHIDALLSILKKTGLDEENLVLSPVAPYGNLSYRNWLDSHRRKRKLYHPCSGNHTAIMLLQRELTGSTAGYELIESLAQQEILRYIKAYVEMEPAIKIDNCGIPTFGTSLEKIAYSYQKLANSSPLSGIERFLDALHSAPVMIEGDGCIATILCSDHNLIAKTGINNLLAIGSHDKKIGIALTTEEGWETIVHTLCNISLQIGLFSEEMAYRLKYELPYSF